LEQDKLLCFCRKAGLCKAAGAEKLNSAFLQAFLLQASRAWGVSPIRRASGGSYSGRIGWNKEPRRTRSAGV